MPAIDEPAGGVPPVLVVDDHDGVRGMYVAALRRSGLQVIEASDGKSALDIVASRPVALVLIDNHMPIMGGVEFVQRLRSDERTRTIPVILMTGSQEVADRIVGLDAGANDYIMKTTRLKEVVARVHAQLRYEHSWASNLSEQLGQRAAVIAELGAMAPAATPEETSAAIAERIAGRPGVAFVSLLELDGAGVRPLASVLPGGERIVGGPSSAVESAVGLVARTRTGPWADVVTSELMPNPVAGLAPQDLGMIAAAPLLAVDRMVAILIIGTKPNIKSTDLLAATIDYAGVASAILSPSLEARGRETSARRELEGILERGAFHPVFQPIVALADRSTVGFEALTRFDDGTPPDIRFADALRNGLGIEFERATIEVALAGAAVLPPGARLGLNVSPALMLDPTWLLAILATVDRPVTIELTEHAAVDDYPALKAALAALPDDVHIAVDDAGAGFASLRHIFELNPDRVKLDMSLVRGIHADPVRQALLAGLVHFAKSAGSELVAEGIEEEDEARTLLDLGVTFGQGYFFGRPAAASTFRGAPG